MRETHLRTSTAALAAFLPWAALGCGSDAPTPEPREIEASSAEVRVAVQSNAHVALELHRGLRARPGNLFYSPLSIEAVLGMLYAGSAGETARQLGEVLDAQADPAAFHAGLGMLLADLGGEHADRGYTLSLANRLFAGVDLDSTPDFVSIITDAYRAPVEAADFSQPESARKRINAWVSEQTSKHIPELLLAGDITRLTRFTLANAVYFKADWSTAFDPNGTRSGMFTLADGKQVTVPMMHRNAATVRTGTLAGARAIELPYRGGDLAFLALLPQRPEGLPALEASLESMDVAQLAEQLGEQQVTVSLPRFTLRTRIDLIPVLRALGVSDLFDDDKVDLSPITPEPKVVVDPFIHEAWVVVDERGTEAAAATAAVGTKRGGPVTFDLDHPFLFFIRDGLTGAVLFTGRMNDPTQP